MEAKIQSIHFDADKKLLAYINKKIQKLDVYQDIIISIEVFLKLDQEGSNIKNKIVEIKVRIRGKILFAKEHSKSFEVSAGLATDSIRRQLRKSKEKNKS